MAEPVYITGIPFEVETTGSFSATVFEPTVVFPVVTSATFTPLAAYMDDAEIFEVATSGQFTAYLEPIELAWVWTSKIGEMTFTKSVTDLRTEAEIKKFPMAWYGYVYQIQKTSVGAIVLGKNGITLCTPNGLDWGKRELHSVGIKGHKAAVWTKRGIFAIDSRGKLIHVADNGAIEVVDYSNYFDGMASSLVMSYDEAQDIVYICDGTFGFVLTQWGLGKGPATITGYGNKSGTVYATTTTGTITFLPLSVITDIQDFGVRTEKIITEIEVGTDAGYDLYGAVSYRWNKADSFITTPFTKADRSGRIHITVSGIEFRFHVKQLTQETIKIDYINVIGQAADQMPLGAA